MATVKSAAKKGAAKKVAPGKHPGRKAVAKKATAKSAAKQPSAKQPAKKQPARKAAHDQDENNYTDPALRERLKREVIAGDKGGRAGQWSARKAQLLAHVYEAEGGGYKHARTDAQKSLQDWGDEKWHTANGEKAIQGEVTHRYLPDEAWKELTPEQREATDEKKVRGSRKGKQFVANTAAASKARQHAEQ